MEKQLKAIVGLGATTQENQSSYKLYSNISPATNCMKCGEIFLNICLDLNVS